MFGGVIMPRISFYVPEKTVSQLRKNAQEKKLSLSKYIAGLVEKDLNQNGWPEGFFEQVVGSWQGEIIEIKDFPLQEREPLL
jgi:hypothetical protein